MARPKKDSAQADVRDRIIDCFWDLFAQQSISTLHMSDIAKAVGCNRSSLYYHFESFEDLVYQAFYEELIGKGIFSDMVKLFVEKDFDQAVATLRKKPRFRRTRLAFAHSSDSIAYTQLYKVARDNWARIIYPDGKALSPQTELVISFGFHGMLSVFYRVLSEKQPYSIALDGLADFSMFYKKVASDIFLQVAQCEELDPLELKARLERAAQ